MIPFYHFAKVCLDLALPVHGDLPVQLIGEGNPGDGARVVVGVNTTEGHHTTLLRVTTVESKNVPINKLTISDVKVYKENVRMLYGSLTSRDMSYFPTYTTMVSLRAQVHGEEVLVDESFGHHVVEDRGSAGGREAWVGQAQDTVSTHVLHEGSFGLTQTKDLVLHREATHLKTTHPDIKGFKIISNCSRILKLVIYIFQDEKL